MRPRFPLPMLFLAAALALASASPVAGALAAPAPGAAAHEQGQSYLYLRVYDDSLVARIEIRTLELEQALGFGWDVEAGVSDAQIEERLTAIRSYVESHFSVGLADREFEPVFRGWSRIDVPVGTFVLLDYFLTETDGIPDVLDVRFDAVFEVDRDHRNFLLIEHNWRTGTFNNEAGISLIFTPGNTRQSLDLSESSLWRGMKALIWLGVLHIWIGIDHILFLVALMLPSVLQRKDGRWQPVGSFRQGFFNIVAVVTFFTIAHSVTLALAGLGVIRLPSALVESVIAASIAVAAAANLLPRLRIREWTLAFVFGLFHGFGFASVMGDIGIGTDQLVLSVLGFNVGVELGQIVIIAAIFPLLFALRSRRVYVPAMAAGSVALIAIALIWFGERAFGWDIYLTQIAMDVLRLIPGVG